MNISELVIRPATPDDAPALADFNTRLAVETEGKRLAPEVILAGVLGIFEKPSRGRYFVAEIDGRIVGQVMHTFEWSDWRNGDLWWLQSVYVHPEFRSRGVFRALFSHVKQLAQVTDGVVGLRLYVENENASAHAVYRNLGLKPAGYQVLEWMADDADGA